MVDEVIDIDEAIALAGAEFIFEEINPEVVLENLLHLITKFTFFFIQNVIYNNVEEDNSATGK